MKSGMKDRLSVKFLFPTLIIVIITASITGFMVSRKIENLLSSAAQEKVESGMNYISMTSNEFLKDKITAAMNMLSSQYRQKGSASLGEQKSLNGAMVNDLLFGGESQTENYSLVDGLKSFLGGTATIFVKNGEDFARISTNIIKEDGQRAVGTLLDPNGKVMAALRQNMPFYGVVDILGKPYITAYEPIHDASGQTIGVLYFGYEMSEIKSLEGLIRKSKVLKDGFYALVDSKNRVIFNSENSSADEVQKILSGDKAYQNWQVKTADFSANGYKVVAAYPEENITDDVRSTQAKVILLSLLLASVLLSMLYYILTRVIIRPLRELENFAYRIASGKMNDSIRDMGGDELGKLARSFNRMLEKIREQISYLDDLPTPVMLIDRDFSIKYINKTGAAILGKDQQRLMGEKCYNNFNTGHCQTEKCACRQAMETNHVATAETAAIIGGKEIPILYTGSPVFDKEGKVVGALEYVADITEIKELQKYLTRSTEILMGEMDRFADGQLNVSVKAEKDDDIGKLFAGFNAAVSSIREMIKAVSEAVQAAVSSASEISASSEQIAAGAQEQTDQTSSITTSVEQITKSILDSSSNMGRAAENSKLACESTIAGAGKVKATKTGIEKIVSSTKQTSYRINSLSKKTEQIGEITQIINEIADQTNLLALNAAIEAARAGEQGRGFAVVADEVRKLAERTTNATHEIAETIKEIQNETKEADSAMNITEKAVEEGMKLTEEVALSLDQILHLNQNASEMVLQVAAATEEQSHAAEEISKSLEGIASVTQQNAAGTEQIAGAAEDLNRLTVNLQQLINRFRMNDTSERTPASKASAKAASKLAGGNY